MCSTCPSLCLSCCTTKPRCWGRIMQAASEWQKSRWFYAQSGWQTREASPWWTTRAKPWWRTVSTSKVSMWTCCHLTAAGHAPASHVQSSASGFGWSAPVFSHSFCNIGTNLDSKFKGKISISFYASFWSSQITRRSCGPPKGKTWR